jgi:hypothetical protein
MVWQKVAWCGDVERCLCEAIGGDGEIIREQVDSGIAALWKIKNHGYFVTRLEIVGEKKELVMVAWQGKNTEPLVKYLIDVCKKECIESIRFHSALSEKLVARFVRRWGFYRAETVYRLEL